MAVSTANVSIALSVHSPKKDAVVDLGSPTVAATAVAIWAAASVDQDKTQSVVGTFDVLKRYALDTLPSVTSASPTVYSCVLGAGKVGVTVGGTPGVTTLQIHIGKDLIDKGQSHFIDRTIKRLIERWLEQNGAVT